MMNLHLDAVDVYWFGFWFRGILQKNYFNSLASTKSSDENPSLELKQLQNIKINISPDEATLTKLNVKRWPTWGCPKSKFPWTYDSEEISYIIEGEVRILSLDEKESIVIKKGYLCKFPAGLSCKWDVIEDVQKHYHFNN
eukprot:gene8751-11823_t